MKKKFQQLLAFCAVVAFAGCASYEKDSRELRAHWTDGRFAEAGRVASQALEDSDEDDLLLWQLERGATLRAGGNASAASAAFEQAEKTVRAWDETPEILLSQEALASLTNLSALPYRGRGSDIIMLHTYRALSFLESGNANAARVALNAAYQAQRDAVERNAEAIENAKKEAEENDADVDALIEQSGLEKTLAQEKQNLAGVRVLADYVNPFTTWLHGIYFLHTGTDGSDSERARVSLSRVAEMYPENIYVRDDAELAASGKAPDEDLTYVVFESGCAPTIGTVRVDTMLFVPTGRGYFAWTPVSIALPKLVLSNERKYWCAFPFASGSYAKGDAARKAVSALSANGVPAAEVCDMNSVVRTDFDNAYPTILTRTLVTAFLKSAASAALNAASLEYARRDDSGAGLLAVLATHIGSGVFTYASSDADLRCWQTLPQNFSIVRMKTPASRHVAVRVGSVSREVQLLPGKVNLVVVKTTGENVAPVISQSVLK